MLCDSIMQLGSGHACLVCSSPCDTELVYRVDAHHRPRGVAWQVRTSPLRTYEVQQSALSVEGRLVASLFSLLELSSPAVLRAVRRFVAAWPCDCIAHSREAHGMTLYSFARGGSTIYVAWLTHHSLHCWAIECKHLSDLSSSKRDTKRLAKSVTAALTGVRVGYRLCC